MLLVKRARGSLKTSRVGDAIRGRYVTYQTWESRTFAASRPGSLPGILLPSVESHHNAPAGKISLRAIAPVLARLLQLVAQSAEPRHSETAGHIPRQGIETNEYPELFRENPELMAVRMSQNHETEQGNYGKYPEFLQSIKRGSTGPDGPVRPAPGGS